MRRSYYHDCFLNFRSLFSPRSVYAYPASTLRSQKSYPVVACLADDDEWVSDLAAKQPGPRVCTANCLRAKSGFRLHRNILGARGAALFWGAPLVGGTLSTSVITAHAWPTGCLRQWLTWSGTEIYFSVGSGSARGGMSQSEPPQHGLFLVCC